MIFQVPVIAVFTKYDQFKRDIKMKLEDEGRDPETHFETEVKSVFDRYYLGSLSGPPPFVRLESEDFFWPINTHFNFRPVGMHKDNQRCTDLIEVTANALSGGVVALMLVAVQRDNLEFSIKKAVEWLVPRYREITMKVCSPFIGPLIFSRGGMVRGVQKA